MGEVSRTSICQSLVVGAGISMAELLTFGHVCDSIKNWQQINFTPSISETVRQMYTRGGIWEFYKGLGWNVLKGCGKGGFRFGGVGVVDQLYHRAISNNITERYPILKPFVVGGSIGFLEAFLLTGPTESVKTKSMTQDTVKIFGGYDIIKQRGFTSLWDGFDAILIRQMMSWWSFLATLDYASDVAKRLRQDEPLTLYDKFAISSTAGLVNVVCTSPFDATRAQLQKKDAIRGRHCFSVLVQIADERGIKGFFPDFKIRAIRSVWYSAIVMTLMLHFKIYNPRM